MTLVFGLMLASNYPVRAQAPTARQQAALVAVRSVFPDMKSRTFEVVPDSDGATEIASFLAAQLGVRMRSVADGKSCRGVAGHCSWKPQLNTTALRVRTRSQTEDVAVFLLEIRGVSNARDGQKPEGFAEQTIVEVARGPAGWRFVRSRPGLIIG
jgi:hypothetical protein